jgi:tetratricopeptide (TPR) repeat protein
MSDEVLVRIAGDSRYNIMPNKKNATPVQYKGVMVSSTFVDLGLHRKELMRALRREELFAIGMEEYVPVPGDDIISSSLEMVRKSSAYIGLISRRYGQIIECPERNPNSFSVSRLEFEEAQRLGLPTLIFVMGENHIVKEAEVEIDPVNREKLQAYRERAKEGRIYVTFNSPEDFTKEAIHNVSKLAEYLNQNSQSPTDAATPSEYSNSEANAIPIPPAFYAEPRYIGLHNFVGRRSELDRLSDWAESADPHPVLLFEAIGGTGKSMLTWQWATKYATEIRKDWAGIFWYSFYEKGAVMTDFCRRALAYITGQPLESFRKKKITELSEQLLYHLQAGPWLIILDGLERVLVAYHRFDAAQIADDQVDDGEDLIAKRDPCAAIRPEDEDLLRTLAAATPSKILITTRLTPRILLSPSNQGIQGVQRIPLPGLRPADAEELIRSCGVSGTSQIIQSYLKSHCDCHPLVIGVLAGLIKEYFPDRGNFDAWASDFAGAGQLNFADLNLVRKRNHILLAAITVLPEKSRQLLSTLALLSESADTKTLNALNPHLPPEPEKKAEPANPEDISFWNELTKERRTRLRNTYENELQQWQEYQKALRLRQKKLPLATKKLAKTVSDLENRGLLQYDRLSKRYDLHPVVRGVSAGRLKQKDKEHYGQRVVDHFSQRSNVPYEESETLEDVQYGLQVVRAYLQMGRYTQASDTFNSDLVNALLFNLEAYAEVLSVGRVFFTSGWGVLPDLLENKHQRISLAAAIAVALMGTDELEECRKCYYALVKYCLEEEVWRDLSLSLQGLAITLTGFNHLTKAARLIEFALDIASIQKDKERLFRRRLDKFDYLVSVGRYAEAESMWQLLDPMGRAWRRSVYRPGYAEGRYAWFHLLQGTLQEDLLGHAEQLAQAGRNRPTIRFLHHLRGRWQLELGNWALAAESFREAIRMAREIGKSHSTVEAKLCLARLYLGQLSTPQEEIERLEKANEPAHLTLAELWLAIGNHEEAKKHALAAYKEAWADGEPYVYRYSLNKATALLKQLETEIPDLPSYNPDKDEKFPWEDELKAAIEELRVKKLAEEEDDI